MKKLNFNVEPEIFPPINSKQSNTFKTFKITAFTIKKFSSGIGCKQKDRKVMDSGLNLEVHLLSRQCNQGFILKCHIKQHSKHVLHG